MGTATLRIAQAFQDMYFRDRYELDNNIEMMQMDIFEADGMFQYHFKPQISGELLFQLIRDVALKNDIHPNDLVILSPTHKTIRNLEHSFRHIARELTSHICETEEEYDNLLEKFNLKNTPYPERNLEFKRELDYIRHGRKFHFWPNAGTVKLSTIHSFKGWEANTLILVISNTSGAEENGSLDELIYTALTRARKNLIIIDTTGSYRNFFNSFSKGTIEHNSLDEVYRVNAPKWGVFRSIETRIANLIVIID